MISVITPYYNKHKLIIQTAYSLSQQSNQNFEWVLVDDGSNELINLLPEIKLIIPHVKFIQIEHSGVSKARNIAISHSSKDYILPLDADDVLPPNTIETYIEYIVKYPNIDIFLPYYAIFHNNIGKIEQNNIIKENDILSLDILKERNQTVCSSLFKKTMWEKIGGYDEYVDQIWHEDWEFWINACYNKFTSIKIPKILLFYRCIPDSKCRFLNEQHKIDQYISNKYPGFELVEGHL